MYYSNFVNQFKLILLQTGTGENQEINNLEKYAVPVTEIDTLECLSEVGKNLHKYSSEQKSLTGGASKNPTVALLLEEIESAVESLKRVHFEMAKLRKENEEIRDSEKRNRQVMEIIISQVLSLQESISNFENEAGSEMNCLNHKLLRIGRAVTETVTSWYQNNEVCYCHNNKLLSYVLMFDSFLPFFLQAAMEVSSPFCLIKFPVSKS